MKKKFKKRRSWQTMEKKFLKKFKTPSPLPLLLAHVK
jgi:hypothetical protein